MERRELGVDCRLVRDEALFATGQQIDDRGGREARGDEALVHAVAGNGVEEAGGVADEQRALARDARPGQAQRQPVAAQRVERLGRETVALAHAAQVLAQPRPLALPGADADVRVVALRKDPAVAAGNRPKLDRREAVVLLPADFLFGRTIEADKMIARNLALLSVEGREGD